jgi:hypothetical protein
MVVISIESHFLVDAKRNVVISLLSMMFKKNFTYSPKECSRKEEHIYIKNGVKFTLILLNLGK